MSEDYALRAKRQALEEETLRRRLALHEQNGKELAERVREAEARGAAESEQARVKSNGDLVEVSVELN